MEEATVRNSAFQFPEIKRNLITSDVLDSLAMCPEFKVVMCRIRKAKKVLSARL